MPDFTIEEVKKGNWRRAFTSLSFFLVDARSCLNIYKRRSGRLMNRSSLPGVNNSRSRTRQAMIGRQTISPWAPFFSLSFLNLVLRDGIVMKGIPSPCIGWWTKRRDKDRFTINYPVTPSRRVRVRQNFLFSYDCLTLSLLAVSEREEEEDKERE